MDFTELVQDAVKRQQPATDYRLAKVLGVQPSTVHHWKKGSKKPTGANLLRLLEITGKMAAGVATLTIAALLYPSDANASQTSQYRAVHNAPGVHIMRIYSGRRI